MICADVKQNPSAVLRVVWISFLYKAVDPAAVLHNTLHGYQSRDSMKRPTLTSLPPPREKRNSSKRETPNMAVAASSYISQCHIHSCPDMGHPCLVLERESRGVSAYIPPPVCHVTYRPGQGWTFGGLRGSAHTDSTFTVNVLTLSAHKRLLLISEMPKLH